MCTTGAGARAGTSTGARAGARAGTVWNLTKLLLRNTTRSRLVTRQTTVTILGSVVPVSPNSSTTLSTPTLLVEKTISSVTHRRPSECMGVSMRLPVQIAPQTLSNRVEFFVA